MKIILIYPDDLGKETEDEIVDWMKTIILSKPHNIPTPLKYVDDLEVERG